MPATDILNPTRGWDQKLGDSMNPSYGYTRKRATTQLRKKAIGGIPWTRETQNTGHVFTFSWLARTQACAQRLKWYYEQYEDGFFTIIDWDGAVGPQGRHYVGRFTTEIIPVETSNNRWDIQNVTFEEMPQVSMVKYPDDWDHDAIRLFPRNDFGDVKLATNAGQSGGRLGAPVTVLDIGGTAAEWGCYEYRGYGFKLFLWSGPAQGQCTVFLDGVQVGGTVDCYAAAASAFLAMAQPNVVLDIHRVQVNVLGTKNGASTGTDVTWCWLDVMR